MVLQAHPDDSTNPTTRGDLHNPREAVVARIGMGHKASFLANSRAIGKKSNAVDRPRPRYHRPQGVVQVIPKATLIKVHH